MSGRWFHIRADIERRPEIAALSHKQFRKKLLAALDGAENEFSDYIRGPYTRPLAHEWRVLREAVFERDDYTCRYCGARGVRLECDHVMPVARGGSSDLANLATACFPCNRAKRDKTLEEWVR